eukprot:1782707-Pyramimonas_sp.AAC.1
MQNRSRRWWKPLRLKRYHVDSVGLAPSPSRSSADRVYVSRLGCCGHGGISSARGRSLTRFSLSSLCRASTRPKVGEKAGKLIKLKLLDQYK